MSKSRSADGHYPGRPRVVGLVLILPILTLAIGFGARWKFEMDWRDALTAAFGQLSPEQFARNTLERVCLDPRTRDAVGGCTEYAATNWVVLGALLTAVIGIGFLALIWLAGRGARRDPDRILGMFKPALYLAVGCAVLLMTLDAGLTMAALYLGEVAFVGWVSPFVIWGIGGAGIIAVIGMSRALLSATKIQPVSTSGRLIDRSTEPRVFAVIDEVSADLAIEPPDHVIVALEPSFFVTEAPIKTREVTVHGRSLHLSLSLSRLLTKSELRALLGHEMAHFAGSDTQWSRAFYPIYRGAVSSLIALRASTHGLSAIAAMPAEMLLGAFLVEFATEERAIGRKREIAADRAAAGFSGALPMACALGKLSAAGDAWERAIGEIGTELVKGGEPPNVAAIFAAGVVENARKSSLIDDATTLLGDPIDTHPTLAERLDALQVSRDEVADVVSHMKRRDSAAALFADGEVLEQELSADLAAVIAPRARAIARAREVREAAVAWVDAHERRLQESVN